MSVAKGAGLIQEVSWQQAASAGITAGLWASPLGAELTETLKGIANASSIDAKMVGDAIMQSGKIAVAAEVLSMAAGKKEFDVANVLASMASTLTNTALAKVAPNELTKTTLSNLSTTAIDSVAHNNFQVETLAANLLGSAMQYGAQKGIEELSPHYQAALNGETVDQNNVARVNAENPGNRNPRSRNNLPSRTAPHHAATYYDDPLLDADFNKLLDPRINVNNPRNANALGNGVAEVNRQSYLQLHTQTPQQRSSGNRAGFWRQTYDTMNAVQDMVRLTVADKAMQTYHNLLSDDFGTASKALLDVGSAFASRGRSLIPRLGVGAENAGARMLGRLGMFQQGGESLLTPAEREFYSKAQLIGRYDYLQPGQLPNDLGVTFIGSRYESYTLLEDIILQRAGTKLKPFGQSFTFDKPVSEIQTRIDKAILPRWPNGGASLIDTGFGVRIPKGSTVHVGDVANQGGIFMGGTRQVVVQAPWLIKGVEVVDTYPLQEEALWNEMANQLKR